MMNREYDIIEKNSATGIKCYTCGLISYNPNDVKHLYCGNCHKFHVREDNKPVPVNQLDRVEWFEQTVKILTSDPFNWPELDALAYVDSNFNESYLEGKTPAEAVEDDVENWEE